MGPRRIMSMVISVVLTPIFILWVSLIWVIGFLGYLIHRLNE